MLNRNKLISAAVVAAGSAVLAATVAPLASGAAPHQAAPKSVKISSKAVKGLGTILTSSTGKTLYTFAPDKGKRVTCGAKLGCDVIWPPEYISASGKPIAGPGVKQSLLGSDPDPYAPGKHVVTYKGWPLYLYKPDTKSGMAKGQDTLGSGGYWYVITTAGVVIKHKPTGGTTTTTTTTTGTTSTTVNLCPPGTQDTDGDSDQSAGGVDDGDGCL